MAVEEPLSYSEPIGPQWHEGPPFQWKLGRAARAEAAFQDARDTTIRACLDRARKEAEDEQRAKDLTSQIKAQLAKVSRYEQCCQLSRACVDEAVTKSISDTTVATNPAGHALRFPLYTALRPLVVLANPGASPSPDPPTPPPTPAQQLLASRTMSHKGGSTALGGASSTQQASNADGGVSPRSRPQSASHGCGFGEALFVRGLVATLLANASVLADASAAAGDAPAAAGAAEVGRESTNGPGFAWMQAQPQQGVLVEAGEPGLMQTVQQQPQHLQQDGVGNVSSVGGDSDGLRGFVPLMSPGCRGTDLVWWDAIQPKMALADSRLARLEALRSCAVAVMVLTQAYVTNEAFPGERDMAMARLVAAQRGRAGHSFRLVVVRLEPLDASSSEGQPKAMPPPPHFGPLPTPPPCPSPWERQPSADPSRATGSTAALATDPEPPFPVVEVLVTPEGPPEAQVARAVAAIRDALFPAGVALPPRDSLHITFSPEDAVAKVLSGSTPPPTPAFRTLRYTTKQQHGAGAGAGTGTAAAVAAAAAAAGASAAAGAAAEAGGATGALAVTAAGMGAAAGGIQEGLAQQAAATGCASGAAAAVEGVDALKAQGTLQFSARSVFGSPFAQGALEDTVLAGGGAGSSCGGGGGSNDQGGPAPGTGQQHSSRARSDRGGGRGTCFVSPASRLRNGLMRLALAATRGTPEDDDALIRAGSASLIDGPYEPGASWVASHSLILPHSSVKPVMEWSCHDVQVWVAALGKSVADNAAQPLLQYSIDGSLLHLASPADLEVLLGVGASRQLKSSLTGLPVHRRPSSKSQRPGVSMEETPLFTLSDHQLEQVFADVVRYYDSDLSGDLNVGELARLLGACGLTLTHKEVSEVRDEYDNDDDHRLDTIEATLLMWDLWRLLLASRDAAAWNLPAASGADFWEGSTDVSDNSGANFVPGDGQRLRDLKSAPSMRRSFSQLTRKSLAGGRGETHSTVWRWAAGRAASIAMSRAVSRAASRAHSRAGSVMSRATSCVPSQAARSVHGPLSVASSKIGRAAFPGGLTAHDLRSLNSKWGGGGGGAPSMRRGSFCSGQFNAGGAAVGGSRRVTKEGASSMQSGADSRSTLQAVAAAAARPLRASLRVSRTGEEGVPVRRNVSIAQGNTPGSVAVMAAGPGAQASPTHKASGTLRQGAGGQERKSVTMMSSSGGQGAEAAQGKGRGRASGRSGSGGGRGSSSKGGSSGGEGSGSEGPEGREEQPQKVKRLLSRIVSMEGSVSSREAGKGVPPHMQLLGQHSMGRVSFAVRDADLLQEGSSNQGWDHSSSAMNSRVHSSNSRSTNPPSPMLIKPTAGVVPKPLLPPGAHYTHEVLPETQSPAVNKSLALSPGGRAPTSNSQHHLSLSSHSPLTLPAVGMLNSACAGAQAAMSQSKRPLRLQGLGGRRLDNCDDASVNGSSMGSTLATDLDVFGDLALTSARVLRAMSDADELASTLRSTLKGADLRRVAALTGDKLRGALVVAMGRMALSGSSPDTAGANAHGNRTCTLLTPFELRLLSNLRPPPACTLPNGHVTAHATAAAVHTGDHHVPIEDFVSAAVEAVARSQDVLMDVVYGPRGTQTLLIQLHMQLYPSCNGQMQKVSEHFKATGDASCAALQSTASWRSCTSFAEVPFDEAPQLLDILTKKLNATLPYVVRTGILQEAAAAAEQCVGTGNEVSVWACVVSHMLHVFTALTRPAYSDHFY